MSSDDLINNIELHTVNEMIQNHPIEIVGRKLRTYMKKMKAIKVAQ